MSRYIDAQEAFNLLADAPQAIVPKVIWKVGIRSILDQCNAIDIVRCAECKWWLDNLNEDNTDEDYIECPFDGTRRIPKPDDFCSFGERKESE